MFLLFFVLFSFEAFAIGPIHIQKGACPYEGCGYGPWTVLKPTQIYETPNVSSPLLLELKVGQKIASLTGEVHVIPGQAVAHDFPPDLSPSGKEKFDKTKPVTILDYVGEGSSRVQNNGNSFEVFLFRTKKDYQQNCSTKKTEECWAEITQEPTSQWWAKIQLPGSSKTGWVLVKEKNLKTTDLLGKHPRD